MKKIQCTSFAKLWRCFMKKSAFTLAEVLIAVVVVGVIAVLLIPAVTNNFKEKGLQTAKSTFLKYMVY